MPVYCTRQYRDAHRRIPNPGGAAARRGGPADAGAAAAVVNGTGAAIALVHPNDPYLLMFADGFERHWFISFVCGRISALPDPGGFTYRYFSTNAAIASRMGQ